MNAYLRNQVAAVFLLLPVATAMVALPTAAMAQTAAPELRSLHISSDGGLSAGAELGFTVEGSARAQTSIRIDGVNRDIALKETSRGVYTGNYTIMRQDALSQTSPIRVTMQAGNRSTVANYTFPSGMANPPVADLVQPEKLKIERFTVVPLDKIEPGAELRFSMTGMRGGSAEVEIPGVVNHIPMREVRPGVYEGAYTIRRQDNLANLTPAHPIVATLWQGEESVKTKLTQGLITDAQPPLIRNVSPREGATLTATSVPISGAFDETGGAGVDLKSVRIVVSGRNVTAGSKITAQLFNYRADLKPGRHTVDVTAKDRAGNAVRKSWSFSVAAPAARRSRDSQSCDKP